MEYGSQLRLMNDRAKVHVGADQIHSGGADLLSSYTGKGVIVGLIDDGVDVMHKDFRDPEDSTKSR